MLYYGCFEDWCTSVTKPHSTVLNQNVRKSCFCVSCHLFINLGLFITARKRSLRQGNIFRSVCQEFCPQEGVCLSACWDTTPRPGRYPPPQSGRHTPSDQVGTPQTRQTTPWIRQALPPRPGTPQTRQTTPWIRQALPPDQAPPGPGRHPHGPGRYPLDQAGTPPPDQAGTP